MMNTPIEFDQLWNYSDPKASEECFKQLLAETDANSSAAAEVMTQIARAQGLQARFEDAHATLDTVEKLLKLQWKRARIRYALERGRVYNSSGHGDAARSMFLEAWELASKTSGEEVLAIDVAHMMGIVEPTDKQMDWNLQALAMADSSEDPKAQRWKGSLYNNIGWSYHDQGQYDVALDYFQKALVEREARQNSTEIRIAKWCIGRTLRSLGRIDDALALQQALFIELKAENGNDGFVCEEIGECLLLKGRNYEATDYFAAAHNELSRDPWIVKQEPERIERLLTLSQLS